MDEHACMRIYIADSTYFNHALNYGVNPLHSIRPCLQKREIQPSAKKRRKKEEKNLQQSCLKYSISVGGAVRPIHH